MTPRIAEILAQITRLEAELEREVAAARVPRGFSIEGGRVRFTAQARRLHRGLRLGLVPFLRDMRPLNLITAPMIYSMILPIALCDLWTTVYQHICFRAYRIPRVRRSDYIVFDRHRLRYLNAIEIVNCLYCGYANGVIAYAREVAGRTEQYWCPIKHAARPRDPHAHYRHFAEYGDAAAYRARLEELRRQLRHP